MQLKYALAKVRRFAEKVTWVEQTPRDLDLVIDGFHTPCWLVEFVHDYLVLGNISQYGEMLPTIGGMWTMGKEDNHLKYVTPIRFGREVKRMATLERDVSDDHFRLDARVAPNGSLTHHQTIVFFGRMGSRQIWRLSSTDEMSVSLARQFILEEMPPEVLADWTMEHGTIYT